MMNCNNSNNLQEELIDLYLKVKIRTNEDVIIIIYLLNNYRLRTVMKNLLLKRDKS
jgi:hypothetical protein